MKILIFQYQIDCSQIEQHLIKLGPKEREVYETFIDKSHKYQFAERHIQLQETLAQFLRTDEKVDIIQLKNGIWKAAQYPDLNISLSSSANLYVIGLSFDRIGVDIEHIKPIPEIDEIVNMFFHPKEIQEYIGAKADQKMSLFFKIWTGKEAYIKAIGEKEISEIYIPFQKNGVPVAKGFTIQWFNILEDYIMCIISQKAKIKDTEFHIHEKSFDAFSKMH